MQTLCSECGMMVGKTEYHPYAACLMFKGCRNGAVVRANLNAVVSKGAHIELPDVDDHWDGHTYDGLSYEKAVKECLQKQGYSVK